MELFAIQKCTQSRLSVISKGVGQDNTSAEHGNSGQSHRQTITIRVNPETYADAPADCYTVTYNRNSQLQAFYYCPRHEYTY